MTHCSMENCDRPFYAKQLCRLHWERKRRNGTVDLVLTGTEKKLNFAKSVIETSQDTCVEWPFKKFANGYGAVKFQGKSTTAHRAVAILAFGHPPVDTMDAAHSCHNRACVNPKHLRWATKSENQADRIINNTSNRGERNGAHKLRKEDVLAILTSDCPASELAEKFQVNRRSIDRIIRGERWGWVQQDCGPEGIHFVRRNNG